MPKKKKSQDVQNELKESAHKIWLAGLGALATAEEEGSKMFKKLVERGETYETSGRKAYEDVKGRVETAASEARGRAEGSYERMNAVIDETVNKVLQRTGVPSREEIALLSRRVEELTKVVEDLRQKEKGQKATGTKTTAAKGGAKSPAAKSTAAKSTASKSTASKSAASKSAASKSTAAS